MRPLREIFEFLSHLVKAPSDDFVGSTFILNKKNEQSKEILGVDPYTTAFNHLQSKLRQLKETEERILFYVDAKRRILAHMRGPIDKLRSIASDPFAKIHIEAASSAAMEFRKYMNEVKEHMTFVLHASPKDDSYAEWHIELAIQGETADKGLHTVCWQSIGNYKKTKSEVKTLMQTIESQLREIYTVNSTPTAHDGYCGQDPYHGTNVIPLVPC